MAKQSGAQKRTVERVMHEFKHGELETRGGRKVKSQRQAVAIALNEAGSSKFNTPKENERNLRRTKRKEAAGETAMDEKEGRGASRRITGVGKGRSSKGKSASARRKSSGRSRKS